MKMILPVGGILLVCASCWQMADMDSEVNGLVGLQLSFCEIASGGSMALAEGYDVLELV